MAKYYTSKIADLGSTIQERTADLQRLKARRNETNAKVRMLREELHHLQEPGSYVGEVVKQMGQNKVLVKINPEGKYVVDLDKGIDINLLKPNTRVALRNDSYTLHEILPTRVDPLVSLMKVEAVPDSTYDMIGGLERQVMEIKEVIELPIKHPELFESLGVAQPKGVLLYGPPGTGKTLLARACANQTNAIFLKLAGPQLVQMFIGDGAKLIRDAFELAKEKIEAGTSAGAILFIDEIDAIGTKRFGGDQSGDREVQRTMLELLSQLDGFSSNDMIKVIAATNRPDVLDPALLRSGRLDRKIELPHPSEDARAHILKIHSRKMTVAGDVVFDEIARSCEDFNGAQLKAVCVEAGMLALREEHDAIGHEDFVEAITVVAAKKKGSLDYFA